jgi:hypothetical protein
VTFTPSSAAPELTPSDTPAPGEARGRASGEPVRTDGVDQLAPLRAAMRAAGLLAVATRSTVD